MKLEAAFLKNKINGVAMEHNNKTDYDLRGQPWYNRKLLAEIIWNKQSLCFEHDLSFQFHTFTFMYTVKRNIQTRAHIHKDFYLNVKSTPKLD